MKEKLEMEVKNSPSFCGKITYGSGIEGMEHLFTKKVKDVMKAAPKGAELYFSSGYASHIAKVGFVTPASGNTFISGAYGLKSNIAEEDVLHIIKTGIAKMKQGVTKSWMSDL